MPPAPIGTTLQALHYRRMAYLGKLTLRRTRGRVRGGPFAGMQYLGDAAGGAFLPKLLGLYEYEVNGAIEAICAREPGLIIDIGSAEGYYSVGLALRNPQAQVIAFEQDENARAALTALAAANNAGAQITVRGKCEPADLAACLDAWPPQAPPPVVLCDIAGHEYYLLDPGTAPALRRAAILVEMHEAQAPGITVALRQRFGPTHHLEHIWAQHRTHRDFPWTTLGTLFAGKQFLQAAVDEQRPWRMAWMWMVPKEAGV